MPERRQDQASSTAFDIEPSVRPRGLHAYGFLFTGKWILSFLLCILFSLLCVYLAGWQGDRKQALDHKNQLIARNYGATPLPEDQGLHWFLDADGEKQWCPVDLTGRYLPEKTLLARNRPHEGQVGFEVLVPFETENGTTVLVDRGWVAGGDSNAAPSQKVPAPPSGAVKAVVRLHAGEAETDKSAPNGQIQSINLPEAARTTGLPLATGAYGILASETPAPASAPAALTAPQQDNGPNLSYEMQWYAFAVLVYAAYVWCARQKVRNDELDAQLAAELERYYAQFYLEDGTYVGEQDEQVVRRQMEMIDDMPAHMKSIVRPRPQKRRKRPTDAEEEDALLDRQGF